MQATMSSENNTTQSGRLLPSVNVQNAQAVTNPMPKLTTFHMLIKGDGPMNGAVVEPIDRNQAKALARVIHAHLSEEEVIHSDQAILVHGCFYQFFGILEKELSLFDELAHRVEGVLASPRWSGIPLTSQMPTENDLDTLVHRTHQRIKSDNPRAPYYVLPVYIQGSSPVLGDGDDVFSVGSNPALDARVAQLLHASTNEIKVLGFYTEASFYSSLLFPQEAVLGDMLRTIIGQGKEYNINFGPVPMYIQDGVVSIPNFTEREWEIHQPNECAYSVWEQTFRSCTRVAHRNGARLNIYPGARWLDLNQSGGGHRGTLTKTL